jgi:hypothetical protein
MISVRRELFDGAPPNLATDRAASFFEDQFLELKLHQLTAIVMRSGALDNPLPAPARKIRMFRASMLNQTPLPLLGGDVFVF